MEGRCPFHDLSAGETAAPSLPASGGLGEGNAEGARLPRRYGLEKTRPRALERQIKYHNHPIAFSLMYNANNKMLCLVKVN